mgnify:CR=1 FL=1
MSNIIKFHYPPQHLPRSKREVPRKVVLTMAKHLGLSENDTIHLALRGLEIDLFYNADPDPQVSQFWHHLMTAEERDAQAIFIAAYTRLRIAKAKANEN